jgi:GT2 family glycosyltransferase
MSTLPSLTAAALDPRPVLDRISVVIPTLGRPILEACLAEMGAGDSWPARIIVVDQGASERVRGWLDSADSAGLRTEYVASDQHGRAAGVNRGLERVRTPLVAVTDDDCLVERDWLRRMVASLDEHAGGIVSGRVEAAGEEEVVAVVPSLKPAVYDRPGLRFDPMSGGNMGVAMEIVHRVGPFDEDSSLRTAEDCDWSYRALRLGVPIVYAPEVCVRHWGWRGEDQRERQYRSYARSHGGFYGKYLRRGDGFIALRAGLHLMRASRRWVRGTLTGDREQALRGRAYLTGLFPGIVDGLRRPGGKTT